MALAPRLKIERYPIGDVEHVVCIGEFMGMDDCTEFVSSINAALSEKRFNLVVDFQQVARMDSEAVGFLVESWSKAEQAGGSLRLAALAPRYEEKVKRIFNILPSFKTLDEAVADFNKSKQPSPELMQV